MDFVSIDFETANNRPSSACSVGLAIVSNGEIVDNPVWLIRPKPLEFLYWNTKIHSIDEQKVLQKPLMRELWPELYLYLNNQTLVAHSASFDMKVLTETLLYQNISLPNYRFACSLKIARRVWPFLPKHGLKQVADFLGYDFVHHDAREDAFISASIVLEAAKALKVNSITELYNRISCSFTETHKIKKRK
jgi:DNA polymerase-3 subunit epsilon